MVENWLCIMQVVANDVLDGICDVLTNQSYMHGQAQVMEAEGPALRVWQEVVFACVVQFLYHVERLTLGLPEVLFGFHIYNKIKSLSMALCVCEPFHLPEIIL
jgi:hypothetical protein